MLRRFFFKRAKPFLRENVHFNINADTKPDGRIVVSVEVDIAGFEILNKTITL